MTVTAMIVVSGNSINIGSKDNDGKDNGSKYGDTITDDTEMVIRTCRQ